MDIALKMKVQDSQMNRLSWHLRNGTSVKVGQGKFECTEAFFDPSLLDMECTGLSDFVFDTIQEYDVSTRKVFYEHIVLW
jgi:hypothetical protein